MKSDLDDAVFSPGPGEEKVFPSRLQAPPLREGQRCLWLTAGEADLLLSLIVTSPVSGNGAEEALFVKIGNYLRTF